MVQDIGKINEDLIWLFDLSTPNYQINIFNVHIHANKKQSSKNTVKYA